MGKYINKVKDQSLGTSFESKCNVLINNGAILTYPLEYEQNIVCVVDNGMFAACIYIDSESTYNMVKTNDGRLKKWFSMNNPEQWID